jgi:hypothetical protein
MPAEGRPAALLQVALRGTACALLGWGLWWWWGEWAMVLAIPLAGVLLAAPLLDLASDLKHGVKAQALRAIEGRHVEYRGRPLDVLEDDAGHRWIATDGLRRIVPGLPSDAGLARLAPTGLAAARRGAPARLETEALLEILARATDADTHRFVRWVEREVALPARRARGAPIAPPPPQRG